MCYLIYSTSHLWGKFYCYPHFTDEQWRHREVKELAQTHTATDSRGYAPRHAPPLRSLPNPAGGSGAARLFLLPLRAFHPSMQRDHT